MIFDSIEKYGKKTAIITEAQSYSYADLISCADQICAPISNSSLVLLLAENTIETIAAYIGAVRKRAPVMLLSSTTPIENIFNIIDKFQPSYIICPIELNCVNYCKVLANDTLSVYEKQFKSSFKIHDDLALLLTTSGSTGSPKFVRLSYKNILANTVSICEYLGISSTDIGITCLPLNYSFGLSLLNTHLYCGASMVVTTESLLSPKFWHEVEINHVTTFSGVPYSFSILKKINIGRFNLSSIRYVTQAGGKLSEEEVKYWYGFFHNLAIDFIIMYGQTEATARMSYLPKNAIMNHFGSIGIPIPGGKFSIKNEDGIVINPYIEGELIYEGANVSMGYAESYEDLSLPDRNNGILCTGDLGYFDSEGYYYITGRKKRFIKLFGNRTNLDDLERLLRKNNIQALCSGKDDNLRIYITDVSLIHQIEKILREQTLISPVAYKIMVINAFPVSDSGKILYSELPY